MKEETVENGIMYSSFLQGFFPKNVITAESSCHYLDKDISSKVIQFCKNTDLSIFLFLLTSIAVLVRGITSNKKSKIYIPPYSQGGEFFMSPGLLPINVNVTKSQTFKELLLIYKEAVLEQYRFNSISTENVKSQDEEMGIVCSMQEIHHIGDGRGSSGEIDFRFSKKESSICVQIMYEHPKYTETIINSIFACFQYIIKQALVSYNTPISQMALLNDSLEQEVLSLGSGKIYQIATDGATISDEFDAQVDRSPDNIAVIHKNRSVTYRQLQNMINCAAGYVVSAAKQDGIVAICAAESIERLASILGVLKAGCAYMPIDPNAPSLRVTELIKDSSACLFLHDLNSLCSEIYCPSQLISVAICHEPIAESRCLNPEQLAYVLYTSGSRGIPKGVMVPHKGIVNYAKFRIDTYSIQQEDTTLQVVPYTFDGYGSNLYSTLFSGGTLVLACEQDIHNPVCVAGLISKNNVTNLSIVPSAYQVILEHITHPSKLRFVALGGEQISEYLLQMHNSYLHQVLLINEYGPTENTITTTVNVGVKMETITNVGMSIWNHKVRVVNDSMQLLPAGFPGEICVEGIGVAKGYIGNNDLTKQHFVESQSWASGVVYRTGDTGKLMPDGSLEYIGRADRQIKINGRRIEPAEIEMALCKIPAIRWSYIRKIERASGVLHLCAYVMCDKDFEQDSISSELSKLLPSYMLPHIYIVIDTIPKLSNGKLDEHGLPSPVDDLERNSESELPQNHIEHSLLEIWKDVLLNQNLGVSDNFFRAGGDSIKAIQVLGKMYKSNIHAEAKQIFDYPTIRELSQVVKLEDQLQDPVLDVPMQLMPIHHWFFQKVKTNRNHFNQSFFIFCKEGFDKDTVINAWLQVMECHEVLSMKCFETESNFVLKKQELKPSLFEFEQHSLDYNNLCSIVDAIQSSFDIFKGPLIKLALFKNDVGDHLLISVHHLLVDGVSWKIILDDFQSAYTGLLESKEVMLPKAAFSYQLWVQEVYRYAVSDQLIEEAVYWNRVLHEIDLDAKKHPERYVQYGKYSESKDISFTLSHEDTSAIVKNTVGNSQYHVMDVLLAGFCLAYKHTMNQSTILISLEGHGRESLFEYINLSRTVGWFTSIYPAVIKIPSNCNVLYVLETVKQTLQAIPNKGVGYGILRYITPLLREALLEAFPDPYICINYMGTFSQDGLKQKFSKSPLYPGKMAGDDTCLCYGITINIFIINEALECFITYNKTLYSEELIADLLSEYKKSLEQIVKFNY